jgi:Protein of unknown function (DUF4232)
MRTRALTLIGAVAPIGVLLALTSGPATARKASAAASPRCHTINLRIRAGVENGAAGSVIQDFRIRNITKHSCNTRGFAGMQLVNAGGRAIPTHPVHGGRIRTVTLRSNRVTHFAIEFHEYDFSHGGRACNSPVARYVRIIPPDEFSYRLVRLKGNGIAPCSGRFQQQPIGGNQ